MPLNHYSLAPVTGSVVEMLLLFVFAGSMVMLIEPHLEIVVQGQRTRISLAMAGIILFLGLRTRLVSEFSLYCRLIDVKCILTPAHGSYCCIRHGSRSYCHMDCTSYHRKNSLHLLEAEFCTGSCSSSCSCSCLISFVHSIQPIVALQL